MGLRRKDAGYPAPPAQSRTCGFPASGSSVVLAHQADLHSCPLQDPVAIALSEVGSHSPILRVRCEFPLRATYSRRVLRHVAGFPNLRLLCPIRHPGGMWPSPTCLDAPCSTTPPGRTPCRGSAHVRVPTLSVSSFHFIQEPSGLPEFSNVSLPACHGLRTPADLHILANSDASVLPSVNVKTLGVRNHLFRSCTSTSGSAISPAAYRILKCTLTPPLFAGYPTPRRDQHAIRAGG